MHLKKYILKRVVSLLFLISFLPFWSALTFIPFCIATTVISRHLSQITALAARKEGSGDVQHVAGQANNDVMVQQWRTFPM